MALTYYFGHLSKRKKKQIVILQKSYYQVLTYSHSAYFDHVVIYAKIFCSIATHLWQKMWASNNQDEKQYDKLCNEKNPSYLMEKIIKRQQGHLSVKKSHRARPKKIYAFWPNQVTHIWSYSHQNIYTASV